MKYMVKFRPYWQDANAGWSVTGGYVGSSGYYVYPEDVTVEAVDMKQEDGHYIFLTYSKDVVAMIPVDRVLWIVDSRSKVEVPDVGPDS
ncbi:MAG TPA: hypothetical protein VLA34_11130 [Candidatus Krumholzibacterium sp.]|nr:hypothetical protein [Candidatus Krumholzibacterium sp.]